MTKKNTLTPDEKVEQATLEAKVQQQEAAEAQDVIAPARKSTEFEPWTDIDLVPAPEGAVVRNHKTDERKPREVRVDGVPHEHCAVAPDGRWIYAKSV